MASVPQVGLGWVLVKPVPSDHPTRLYREPHELSCTALRPDQGREPRNRPLRKAPN